jgi:AcrR family transcriptional regulator
MPPTADKKTATRDKILQAALVCFAQKGYHQTSMDDIVAQSELSKGTLYWHFKSKQELFLALLEWFMLEFDQEVTQAWAEEMPAADKLRAMVRVSLDSSEQIIPFFKIFLDFWARTMEDTQILLLFSQMITEFQNQLTAVIEAGIASGEFRPVNARPLALAMFGMLDALLLYRTLLGDQVDMRGSAEAAVEVLLAGLQPHKE